MTLSGSFPSLPIHSRASRVNFFVIIQVMVQDCRIPIDIAGQYKVRQGVPFIIRVGPHLNIRKTILGVRAGRAVVIAAALIMASVFGSFILSESIFIRPIALALAMGVLVDAFIVRLIIMPAVILLAGDWAWWVPRRLDGILPNVDVEGAVLERRHPHVAPDHLELGTPEAEATVPSG